MLTVNILFSLRRRRETKGNFPTFQEFRFQGGNIFFLKPGFFCIVK